VSDRGALAVVPAVIAANPGKAVGKDAAFEVFAKRLLYVDRRGVVIALAVELAGASQLQPGLEVLGYRLVQQGAFWMAGVVGFGGFGWLSWLRGMRVPTRVMVNVLW